VCICVCASVRTRAATFTVFVVGVAVRSLLLLSPLVPALPRHLLNRARRAHGVAAAKTNAVQRAVVLLTWLLALALPSALALAQAQAQAQTGAEATADSAQRFTVKAFHIQGATLVPEKQLQAALAPWLNKPITLLHLQHAARTMAEVYRAEGWPVRPRVPSQDVAGGVATLGVVETRVLEASGLNPRALSTSSETELPTQVLLAGLAGSSSSALLEPVFAAPVVVALDALTPLSPPVVLAVAATPDAGSLLRDTQRDNIKRQNGNREAPAQPFKSTPQNEPPAANAAAAPADPTRFTVKTFRIVGATLVADALLQAALAPWLNRPISFVDLQEAARALAEVYRAQGWLARPQVPAQELVDGVVTLNVVEARLGQVRIDHGGQPLRADRHRLHRTLTARQRPDEPLNLESIDRGVNLLNNLPGLRVDAVLAPGVLPGQTDVVLKPQDQAVLTVNVLLDNQGARSTGTTRASVNAAVRSPSGAGDELLLAAQTTGAGNDHFSLNYSAPVGFDGWRLAANASALDYRLLGEFAAAQAEGSARILGVQLRYPLRRSVSLSLALESRHYRNDANSNVASDKHLTTAVATLSGDASDNFGRGGLTIWSTSLSAGEVDLSANPAYEAADAAGPRSAGRYARFSWSVARLQNMGERNSLWLSLNGQNASTNLDSSEKFSLGGVNGVRAYSALEGTGDSGWLATVEWRYMPRPGWQMLAFYDHGQSRVNRTAFAGAAALNDITLKGVGLGLNWNPNAHHPNANWGVRAQVSRRIGVNPLANTNTGRDSDGSYTPVRPWLGLSAQF
jgi:hemolysin activation/secretion protein